MTVKPHNLIIYSSFRYFAGLPLAVRYASAITVAAITASTMIMPAMNSQRLMPAFTLKSSSHLPATHPAAAAPTIDAGTAATSTPRLAYGYLLASPLHLVINVANQS